MNSARVLGHPEPRSLSGKVSSRILRGRYMLPVQRIIQDHMNEMERIEAEAEQQGREPEENPPFPFEELLDVLKQSWPTAAVEVCKSILLSFVKWTLDGLAAERLSQRQAWSLTKDVRRSIARKGKTLTWYQRAVRAPATLCRGNATMQFASFIVSLPLEVYRVAKQSRRDHWDFQKTSGVLVRVVVARIAVQEIGLLAACIGCSIGAAIWPNKATWFATIFELPALFIIAPEVDSFFGIIMDPPPLGPDGAYPGVLPTHTRTLQSRNTTRDKTRQYQIVKRDQWYNILQW
ncbi:hypothetical protein WJX84_011256 [Apatococcus fuscideae]|uniref:Uncharacterized protein n=1 Tax=Apatococcus fuscideae TaxID=2026836 RepID=A0AAW1SY57_9CHLO